MKNTTFFKFFSLVIVSVVFVSCDKDYNTIGSDIVGNKNFNFTHEVFGVKAYNQKVPAVQTNNLPINQLGIFTDGVGTITPGTDILGKTKANFVTQLSLVTPAPTFNSNVVIDSVVLTVPYFSSSLSVDSNAHNTYRLDSIYSSNRTSTRLNPVYDPIDLKVYPNGFYLNDYNPSTDFATAQKYYSDQDAIFDGQKVNTILNDKPFVYDPLRPGAKPENTAFEPDTREIIYYKVNDDLTATLPPAYSLDKVVTRLSPRMRLHLNTNYFLTNVIQAPASALVNNNAFRSYFKGLYFQVQDAATGSGSLMSLNFSKGDVTIYYKQDIINNDTAIPPKKEMKTFVMNMTGNTVNLLNNTDNTVYAAAASNPNNYQTNANTLYLKGGQGSKAYVELFSNPGELAALKAKNVLVNDASLTFTVDQTNMTDKYRHPQRIYIFDADNNKPVLDYYVDNSVNAANFKLNKYIYSGIKQVNKTANTIIYKVRITEFVNKILKETVTTAGGQPKENVRLGVVVSENINLVSFAYLKNGITVPSPTDPAKSFDRIPVASVMNPLGTVFYGTNSSVPLDKAVKFEIYYTKPN